MKPVETMAGHLHKVTYKEQLIICHVIRERSDELKYAHLTPALLPFVPMENVQSALRMQKISRPVAQIAAKLKTNFPQYLGRVWLSDHKVVKVFGPEPSKGRRFNWLPPTFDKGKPIEPRVALKFVRKTGRVKWGIRIKGGASIYDVVVHEAYRQPVLAWLCDNLT